MIGKMFNLFKKKDDLDIAGFVDGEAFPIEEASDEVFSSKAMGDGYGVIPSNGIIYSPCSADVVTIFPTGHAIGLKMKDGTEVLLHLGIDTVDLGGTGFKNFVKQGEKVHRGQKIAEMDLEYIESQGKNTQSFMIFTSMEKIKLKKVHANVSHDDLDIFDFIS